MLRIIANRDASMNWRAWWLDNPVDYEVARSAHDAVTKLLDKRGRGVSMIDLVIDPKVSRPWHVEMTVSEKKAKPD